MNRLIYVETTIPSFYFETRPGAQMQARREWTWEWWDTALLTESLVTSPAVLDELNGGPSDRIAEWLALVQPLPVLSVTNAVTDIVLAYLTHAQHAALNFVEGEGLLMAPTLAVARLLDRAGLTLQDFDLYEIHEAFAAQVLCTLRAWESGDYARTRLGGSAALGSVDRTRMNVMGSSLAFGHPFAATGARIVANLAKLLSQRGGRGLISICTAGGMGVAAILESTRNPRTF